jgi:7-cyano-7-deazaguanine synthase in queuosine biosynthesis
MFLDGVPTTTWLGPFSVEERDLLRVMAAVLDADRLSPRRPRRGGRLERDIAWQRRLNLCLEVEAPERWTGAASLLIQLLSFMTDDAWHIEFVGCKGGIGVQQVLPFERFDEIGEVALFSGGLDSVAGLQARSNASRGKLLAVSACGNGVLGTTQRAGLAALDKQGVSARWLKLDHQLRGANRSRNSMESSQRSRGLLFLAMGAVAASRLQHATFSVYETGIGCINLPTSAAQVGAQGTRAMHPRTLALFNQLLQLVLDFPPRVVVPYFLHTKGELCGLVGSALPALASVSMSCDEGDGHKTDAMLHCGLCTSCLFRRISLNATGHHDQTKYRDIATRRHGTYEISAFENHAAQLAACRSFDDLLDIDPDVSFSTEFPFSDAPARRASKAEVFEMYQRYATEIRQYFESRRPTVTRRNPPARKERERDLFSAVG